MTPDKQLQKVYDVAKKTMGVGVALQSVGELLVSEAKRKNVEKLSVKIDGNTVTVRKREDVSGDWDVETTTLGKI